MWCHCSCLLGHIAMLSMACCYSCSVVCLPVCLLDTLVSCAKMAEPIWVPFQVKTRGGEQVDV